MWPRRVCRRRRSSFACVAIPEFLSYQIGKRNGTVPGSDRCGSGDAGLMLALPLLEQRDGFAEAVPDSAEQVDVVDVPAAGETVGEVVARVDGGERLGAVGTLEAKAAFDRFRVGRPRPELQERDGHGQVVAQDAQQLAGDFDHDGSLSEFGHVDVLAPVRLDQDAVDLVDVDGLVRGADGFEHAGDAKVARLAQDAIGWRHQ